MLNKSKLKERKGERMHIDDNLTSKERKTQKKLREVVREKRERERKKAENRIQEDTDKWGMIYMGWERRETEEKFLEEGEKKRRGTGEKRYKEQMNKKIDGQRKRKPEKKHKRGKSLPKEYN
jgi:hypothetical protein